MALRVEIPVMLALLLHVAHAANESEGILWKYREADLAKKKTEHAYYDANNYATKVNLSFIDFGSGEKSPAPDSNTIFIYAKTFDHDQPTQPTPSTHPHPSAFFYLPEPESKKDSFKACRVNSDPEECKSHEKLFQNPTWGSEGYVIFHFRAPTFQRRLTVYEVEEEGSHVQSVKREEYVWVYVLPVFDQFLSKEAYHSMVREIVSFIWEEDLKTVKAGGWGTFDRNLDDLIPPVGDDCASSHLDWITAALPHMKEKFEARRKEWHTALTQRMKVNIEHRKSTQLAPWLSSLIKPSFSWLTTVDEQMTLSAIGQSDARHPEVVCDADLATALEMAGQAKAESWGDSMSQLVSKAMRLVSGQEEQKKHEPQHIIVEKLVDSGSIGSVFKVRIRPRTTDDGGEPVLSKNSPLHKYKIAGTENDYGPFAMKLVSLKRLFEKKTLGSLYSELFISGAFEHPFITSLLFACNPSDDQLALISEYAENGSAFNIFYDILAPEYASANNALVKLLSAEGLLALNYIRGLGLVHGDVKPMNILSHKEGHFSLTDFGSLGEIDRVNSNYLFSSNFSSPEALTSGRPMCAGMDLWALGATLYSFAAWEIAFKKDADARNSSYKPTYESDAWQGRLPLIQFIEQLLNRNLRARESPGWVEKARFLNEPDKRYMELVALGVVRAPMIKNMEKLDFSLVGIEGMKDVPVYRDNVTDETIRIVIPKEGNK